MSPLHQVSNNKGNSMDSKPAWYEHTLRNDRGEAVNTIIADHDGPAFGRPDVDYDKLFSVEVVPLYYPGEVERLRAEVKHLLQTSVKEEVFGTVCKERDTQGAKLAELEALHGGELGLPKEGWPEYHKRKMESLRDLTAGHYQRKLDVRDSLLREVVGSCALVFEDHQPSAETIDLQERCEAVLSASTEADHSVDAEPAPAPKISAMAMRMAMENLAVRATYGVDQPPEVLLNGIDLRVHYSGMKWYHEHLVKDRWTALTVDEFDALLTEALAKS